MKRKITAIMAVLLALALLTTIIKEIGRVISRKDKATVSDTVSEETDTEEYYTYHDVETIVGYLADSEDEADDISRLIDPLGKSEAVTVSFVKSLAETIGAPDTVYSEILSGLQSQDRVSKEQFDAIYHNIAQAGVVSGLERLDVYVYDSRVRNDDGTEQHVIWDGSEQYVLDVQLAEEYRDSIIDVYIKNDRIFKINGYAATDKTLRNVWLVSVEDGVCTFIFDGLQKSYRVSEEAGDAVCSAAGGCVASVTLDNSGVVALQEQDAGVDARIDKVTDSGFFIKNMGTLPISSDFRIYNVYNEPFCEESLPILTGYREVSLVLSDGEVIAAVVDDELVCDDIRVILSNDKFTSYAMDRVDITSDVQFKVIYPDESETICESGNSVTVSFGQYETGDIIRAEPTEHGGRLQITSLNRSYGHPSYAGTLEIEVKEDALHVINVVPLEEYLYSVVSSEMPSSSHEEALKAQAICARGYAYTKMNDESFASYHAHLDDSSLCQVYNNVQETKETVKAVKDTYGIVPTYNGTVIVPLYFSTSCGMTCTNEEIWGGSAYPYLESNVETVDKDRKDLSDEDVFRQFMADSLGYDIIDRDMPYYRWSVSYTDEEITQAVNSMLEERISMSSDNIKVKNDNDEFVSKEISDIGTIVSIEITDRTKSGVVSTMEIEGTNAVIQVTGQTNIRNLITPVNQEIVRGDGTMVTGWTSLPSPYYYIEETEGGFVIHGGGFGHGSGMSQNGANVLAQNGYNYKYILRHYYSYIDFSSIYTIEDREEAGE